MDTRIFTGTLFAAAVIVFGAGMSVLSDTASATEYRYVAHRGIVNGKYPGNSLDAIKQAAATPGIWGIETDIWQTKDGKFVCIHGKDSAKETKWGKHQVTTTKRSTLRKTKVKTKTGYSYTLPTLEEYLDACKSGGKVAVIEIKDHSLRNTKVAKNLLATIKAQGMLDRSKCMFISFDEDSVRTVKKVAKDTYKVKLRGQSISNATTKKAVQKAVNTAVSKKMNGLSLGRSYLKYVKDAVKKADNKEKAAKLKIRSGWHDSAFTEEKARKLIEDYNLFALTTEFTPAQFTVKFEDGITGSVFKEVKVLYGENISLTAPQHEGYKFREWSNKTTNITQNIIVKALYDAIDYTVTFKDGLDGSIIDTSSVAYGKSAKAPTPLVHEGYSFVGWDKDFSKVTGNITVSSKYEGESKDAVSGDNENTSSSIPSDTQFTVRFLDKDSKTMKSVKARKGSKVAPPTPRKYPGYTFKKWNNTRYTRVTNNLTVRPVYTRNTYVLTYQSAEQFGDLALPASKKYNVETKTFDLATLKSDVKPGYTFLGWYSPKGGKVSSIKKGTAQNTTVKAKFRANTYTVLMHSNYGNDTTVKQPATYGRPFTLTKNTKVRNGYEFLGWSLDPKKQSVEYTDGAKIEKSLTTTDKATVHLYGVWEPVKSSADEQATPAKPATETPNKNSGNENATPANTSAQNSNTVSPAVENAENGNASPNETPAPQPAPVVEKPANAETPQPAAEQPEETGETLEDEDLELGPPIAKYAVLFDANGGAGDKVVMEQFVNEGITIPACSFTAPEGKIFACWNSQPDGTGKSFYPNGKVTSSTSNNTTLYAQWANKGETPKYTLLFNANGGSGEMESVIANVNTRINLPKCSFTRSGEKVVYKFVGWCLHANGRGIIYPDEYRVYSSQAKEITLYAQWERVFDEDQPHYTIVFNANGGTGALNGFSAPLGARRVIPGNTFTREGYEFAGWNTRANGKGTAIKDGHTIYSNRAKTITFYAQWKPIGQ